MSDSNYNFQNWYINFQNLNVKFHLQTIFLRFKILLYIVKITIDSWNNCYVERLCEVGRLTYIIYNMRKKNKRHLIKKINSKLIYD